MKLHFFFTFFLLTSAIFAQEELALNDRIYTLEELQNITIVSSTGTEKSLKEAPSIATVITAEQIERSSARTLSQILAMVPGLKVYSPSLNAMSDSYDIRGIATGFNSQILFLMNGTPMNNLFSSSPLIHFQFPASAIQRVEVVRGPGSAIYGADAFSGIINIITKDANYLKDYSQEGVRYGSFESMELFGNYGDIYENGLKMGLNLSYMSTKGDNGRVVKNDLQSVLDGIFKTTTSTAPSSLNTNYDVLNLNLNLVYENLEINLWGQTSEKGTNAGITNALDPSGKIKQQAFMGDFIYRNKLSNDIKWENKLKLTYFNNEMDYGVLFPAGATLPIGDDGNFFTSGGGLVTFSDGVIGKPAAKEYWAGLESTLYFPLFKTHKIRLSTGYTYARLTASEKKNFGPGILNGTEGSVNGTLSDVTGTPYVYSPNVTRRLFFLSLQDENTFATDWSLTTGVRYDNYSDFGETLNPRVGLVWTASDSLVSKLLYGRAFRAPSVGELFWINNPAILGNKNVKPETIDTVELDFSYNPNKFLHSSINFYGYEANDLISTVKINTGQEYQNIEKQLGMGTEFTISHQTTDNLLISADYAYRWTKNVKTSQAVAKVPKHLFHAMLDYSISREWIVNTEMFYVADTPRAKNDVREKIKDYEIVNLSTKYTLQNGFSVTVAARNLLNKKYVNPSDANSISDYPMEGRSIYAELKYRF